MRNNFLLYLGFALLLISCGIENQTDADVHIPTQLSRRDELRFKQYMVNGKSLYLSKCANCHQQDGKGLEKLYPPLAKADYLINNVNESICMVKYGYTGPLTINGTTYNMVMPEFEQLTPLEIAEILTYVGNKWGNTIGFVDVNRVNSALQSCNSSSASIRK